MRFFRRFSGSASVLHNSDRTDEPVSLTHDSLYETGLFRILFERKPDLPDCSINALFSIEEDIFAPQPFDDFFPANKFTLFIYQKDEQFHWNLLDPEHRSVAADLIPLEVEQEIVGFQRTRRHALHP